MINANATGKIEHDKKENFSLFFRAIEAKCGGDHKKIPVINALRKLKSKSNFSINKPMKRVEMAE